MYRFTIPGVYYYSSGYLDNSNAKMMQGVVKVHPLLEKSNRIVVYVGGIEAKHAKGGECKNNFFFLVNLSIVLHNKQFSS